MKLVACPECHTQFDVAQTAAPQIVCPCGTSVDTAPRPGKDTPIHRCGSCGASVALDATECGYCQSTIVRDTRKLSLICPQCYARNPNESHFCTSCGVRFNPQPWSGTESTLSCPACDDPMTHRTLGDVPSNECGSCRGLWLSGAHFQNLVRKSVDARRKQQGDPFAIDLGGKPRRRDKKSAFSSTVAYRKCPVCTQTMHRKNFGRSSGVIIDRCREHGTWVDSDELEDIVAFVMAGSMATSHAGPQPTTAGTTKTFESLPASASGEALDAEKITALLTAERMFDKAKADQRTRRVITRRHGNNPLNRLRSIIDFLTDLLD